MHQAGLRASTASYAAQQPERIGLVLSLAEEAMPLPRRSGGAEVVPAGHGSKLVELARIPFAYAPPALERQIHLIRYVEAVARGTHVGAHGAGQAALAQFLPQPAVVRCRKQAGKLGHVELQPQREARPLVAHHAVEARRILIAEGACRLEPDQQRRAAGTAH